MSNGNNKYPQYTRNMTEAQKAQFDYMVNMFETRRQRPLVSGITVSEEEKEYKLSDYDQDIQNLMSNEQYGVVEENARKAGIDRILELGGMDSESFFKDRPKEEITAIEAMRATNYKGFADKEKIYSGSNFRNENTSKEALKKLNEEYNATFQNSFLFPEMGAGLNELLPDYIKSDPEKRAQFERAFYYERGAKIDFDESGRVGDINSDSLIGDAVRGTGYYLNDLMAEVVDSTIGTATAIYDIFGGDPSQADEDFLKKQEAGEIETAMEREERLQGEGVGFDDDIFWAAFSSPEARRQLYATNKGTVRTVDFQSIMDRGGVTEATAGELWGAGMDQLIQSAPLLLDLALGSGIAKGLLKGATAKIGTRAAAKAGKKALRKEGSNLVRDPRTGRFISEGAAKQIDNRVDYMLAEATKSKQRLNQVGAFFVSDALVASQMHSDNVGQDWYDNLSGGERFAYLGVQAGAEVASGMVLSNIFARGFGAGKMTQKIFKGQKASAKDYAKNIVRSSFLGATEEVIAEGATAGVQYWSEIQARIAGGDPTAYYDPKEMNRRIYEGASAGLLMGGLAGGFSGTVGGAAQATLGNFANSTIEAKKEVDAATRAVDQAATATAKAQAMRRLENATKKYTAAQGAMARAYNKLAQSDRESFDEIARTQGQINALVQRYKESNDPEYQGSVEQEVKALVQKKQQLEEAAAKNAGAESFSALYGVEFDELNKKRGEKVAQAKAKIESNPDVIAERELAGQREQQKEALDAAVAANSPDQNADDDAQDKGGQTEEDLGIDEDYEPQEGDTVNSNEDGTFGPNALAGTSFAGLFRDLSGKLNNYLKAFSKFGVNAVVHTNSNSFYKATGEKAGLGFFRDGKTVHINLEQVSKVAAEEATLAVKTDTIRHEFLHAAFKTLTPAQKTKFLQELQSLGAQNSKLREFIKDIVESVEKEYTDYTPEQLTEEKAVSILEYILDTPELDGRQGIINRVLNLFRRLFGLDQKFSETDLQGFVRRFRDAEREGRQFDGEQVSDVGSVAGRDIGMRQPSKAYPDLINKVVNYRVYYLDKLGGQQSYQTNGLRFNDYWHFRNWYLKETGNGKMANNIGQFTYTGDDGTLKRINPPKPKRDRETGEIIDMEPQLKTPQQRKIASNEADATRSKRASRYKDIKRAAGKALNFAVGKIEKIGRTGELAFYGDNMVLEQDSQSELPVAYSETFFTEGLNIEEISQLGRDFGDNLQFLIPTDVDAQLAFTVRNNGDGTVTIEAHSDVITEQSLESSSYSDTAQPKEGVAKRGLNIGRKYGNIRGRIQDKWNPETNSGGINGLVTRVFGFDRTQLNSGIADLIKQSLNQQFITAHRDQLLGSKMYDQMVEMAQETIDRDGLKPGDIGYFAVSFSLLGEDRTIGNPFVFQQLLDKEYDQETDDLTSTYKKSFLTSAGVYSGLNARNKEGNLTGKAVTFREKVKPFVRGGSQEMKDLRKNLRSKEDISLSESDFDEIKRILKDQADGFSFDDRVSIASSFLTEGGVAEARKKFNDPIWGAEDKTRTQKREGTNLGEVVAYMVVPFQVDEDGRNVSGFYPDEDTRKNRPFKGVVKYEEIEGVEPPYIQIPEDAYHLGEIFPNLKIKKGEKGDSTQKTVAVKDLTKKQQQSALSSLAGISAVKGVAEFENVTRRVNKGRREYLGLDKGITMRELTPEEKQDQQRQDNTSNVLLGISSRGLNLNPDNASNLPFQPNNLNGFEAFMARMDQLFANKYANVFSLQRAVEKAKKSVVDLSQDFINAETLMYGKTANDLEKLDEKVKVISQDMKDAGLIGEDVSQFLIARHAEERNALIAERTDGETLNGSGMSNERAQEVMDSFSPERKAALESIAKKVNAITKDTRQTMVKFGLESQETIDAFEEMFDNYVPLGGLSVDEMSADTSLYPTGGAGMSIYGDTTRRAKGRASEANNVLAQAIAQNAAVHAKARKNEALSSLYNLVEDNPNTKVWKISNEVPFDAQSAVGVRVNGEQKFIVFTNPDHAKALKNMGVEKLDLFSKIMRSFSGFLRRSFTTANPEFIISNFARDIQSALFNAMAEADMPGGQIQSKYIATKIIERVKQTLPALLKGAVGKDLDPEMAAYFEEFKEDGGQTGWGFVKDVGTIAAEIEAEVNEKNKAQKAREWMMKNSIDVVENVNDAFENSIRLAAYMEARKAGTSREKAAELAKNITVNFNRSGELGAVANAWYMFFNASVQGTVRLARSLGPNALRDIRKPDGELDSWHKRLNGAQKLAFGLSLTTGMLTAINLAMSDEDEDGVLFYNKIPDYEKERNLIIMYDGKNYLKIPLPYGFNVFANMGTSMAEVAGGQRDITDAGMFLLNSAFSSFSPVSFGQSKDAAKYLAKGATPTIFKPLVDIAVNESYFGSSVYKEQFPVGAPKPEAEMSFRAPEGVRSFFKWMNEATGGSEFVPGKADFNPDKFWYGFEYYIGGAGQFVTRTLGTGRDAYEMIKEGEKVPMKSNDFPFLRKLYGEFSKYYDSDVYVENTNTVSQLYKERKEADNKSDKRYRGIMKLESSRKRTEKQIKRLRQLRKEARDIKNYVERQNRIYELYEKERSLLMQFNKQFETLRGKD